MGLLNSLGFCFVCFCCYGCLPVVSTPDNSGMTQRLASRPFGAAVRFGPRLLWSRWRKLGCYESRPCAMAIHHLHPARAPRSRKPRKLFWKLPGRVPELKGRVSVRRCACRLCSVATKSGGCWRLSARQQRRSKPNFGDGRGDCSQWTWQQRLGCPVKALFQLDMIVRPKKGSDWEADILWIWCSSPNPTSFFSLIVLSFGAGRCPSQWSWSPLCWLRWWIFEWRCTTFTNQLPVLRRLWLTTIFSMLAE